MSLTVKEELRRTFERATLRREAEHLRTPRQWGQAKALIRRADAARDRETRLFRERFDLRVELARRRLVDAAGTPTRALRPGWASHDRFHPADLLRLAQRDVHARHHDRLARIDDAETRALAGLVRGAERQNDLKGAIRLVFKRAADPPVGPTPPGGAGPART